MSGNTNKIVDELKARAEKLGFVAFGVAKADLPPHISKAFLKALDENWHGDMEWMKTSADRRLSPQNMWPDARSAIVVAYNYAPDENPMVGLKETDKGVISVYARNRDYHEIIKGKLKSDDVTIPTGLGLALLNNSQLLWLSVSKGEVSFVRRV